MNQKSQKKSSQAFRLLFTLLIVSLVLSSSFTGVDALNSGSSSSSSSSSSSTDSAFNEYFNSIAFRIVESATLKYNEKLLEKENEIRERRFYLAVYSRVETAEGFQEYLRSLGYDEEINFLDDHIDVLVYLLDLYERIGEEKGLLMLYDQIDHAKKGVDLFIKEEGISREEALVYVEEFKLLEDTQEKSFDRLVKSKVEFLELRYGFEALQLNYMINLAEEVESEQTIDYYYDLLDDYENQVLRVVLELENISYEQYQTKDHLLSLEVESLQSLRSTIRKIVKKQLRPYMDELDASLVEMLAFSPNTLEDQT
ncbi:hypothetical protein HOC01_03110 [archaeon]|jgi:hypothetical protein|nr:hypothetical protein [archaeon]MBT6698120.1 hypothetical protein [archaeon]